MSNSLLPAFILFAAVMFFTPGPNNIMVMSSGLTFGFRRTLPHIAGVTIGFAFMVARSASASGRSSLPFRFCGFSSNMPARPIWSISRS